MDIFIGDDVNDMQLSNTPFQGIIDDLRKIVDVYKSPGTSYAEVCEIVAQRLRKYSGENCHWCGRYVRQIIKKSLPPSKSFSLAVRYEMAVIEKWNNLEIELEKVVVLAPIGRVKPNTLLCQKPKICPKCGITYFRNSPRQVICDYCRYQKGHKTLVVNKGEQ